MFGIPWVSLARFPLSVVLCRAMPSRKNQRAQGGATALGAALVTASLWSAAGRLW